MELTINELRDLLASVQQPTIGLAELATIESLDPIGSSFLNESVILRSRDSGVWIGTLDRIQGADAELTNARRIWSWRGAAELSQLSQQGVNSTHAETRIGVTVPRVAVLGGCEILPASPACVASIKAAAEWTK